MNEGRNMNEISKAPKEPVEVKWGQFETRDGKLVIYEVGNVNGWIVSNSRARNRL